MSQADWIYAILLAFYVVLMNWCGMSAVVTIVGSIHFYIIFILVLNKVSE